MTKEFLLQGNCCDDVDDLSEDEYEDEDDDEEEEFLVKGEHLLKKGLPENRKKDKFPDPSGPKKRQKEDAKNRYWRKHRDDVNW